MKRLRQHAAALTLLSLLLASWAVLTWQLGQRSLWVDEFLSRQMIRGSLADVVAAAMGDLHPPLYFLILHTWTALAGTSDFALRFPSIAFALCGLALIPGVARRLSGARVVTPALILLCFAPAFIELSRMARYYSLLLMLGLLGTKFLLHALADNRRRNWIAYALSSLALLYTFYPSGILLLAQALMIVWPARWRDSIRRWLITLVVIGVGFMPWLLASAAGQISNVGNNPGADLARSGLGFILGISISFYTFSVGETLFPWQPAAWIGLGVVAVLLVAGLRRGAGRWASAGLFLISIAFISLVTTFVAVGTPFLNVPVRGLFALPFYLLVAGIGLSNVTSRRLQLALVGALLVVWSISIANYFSGQQTLNPIYLTPSKEAAAFVRQAAAQDDLVISDYDSVFGYYFLAGGTTQPHLYTNDVAAIHAALTTSHAPRVWLITIGRDQTQRSSTADEVRQMLAAQYRLAQSFNYLPIDPTYLRVKELLLRRATYDHRLTVDLYEHQP